MNNEENEEMVKSIVNRVIQEVGNNRKTALVVFTGGASGFKESLSQLKEMIADHWHLKVALSISAEYIFTPELIKEQLGIDKVYLESENTGLKPLYDDTSVLIIPTLTTNTVAKVACGITDNMTLNLISHFIMTSVPIVAARDSCDLSHIDRQELGMKKPPSAYMELFDRHIQTLESFGVQFGDAVDIYQIVQGLFDKTSTKPLPSPDKQTSKPKKVLSQKDVMKSNQGNKELIIQNNTMITPLAAETAKELGINIKKI